MKRIISPINLREDRLPLGQHWTDRLIILGISDPPEIDLKSYRLKIFGEVEEPVKIDFEKEFEKEIKKSEPVKTVEREKITFKREKNNEDNING